MKKSLTVTAVSFISFALFTITAEAQSLNAVQQTTGAISSLSAIVDAFTGTLVKSLGTLAMAAAVVAFFYGIVQYVWGVRQAEPKVIQTGNEFMKWGLVALFVMFSVYGIIKFGQNILFNNIDVTKITIPEINFVKSGTQQPGVDPFKPAPPGLGGQNSDGKFLCPDGATYANDISSCPVYTCPDGTRYYNQSDAKYCKTVSDTGNTQVKDNTGGQTSCGPDETLVDGYCYTNNTP